LTPVVRHGKLNGLSWFPPDHLSKAFGLFNRFRVVGIERLA
jgi:hypothetical protein